MVPSVTSPNGRRLPDEPDVASCSAGRAERLLHVSKGARCCCRSDTHTVNRPGTAILERRRAIWLRQRVLAPVPPVLAPGFVFEHPWLFRVGFLGRRPWPIDCMLHAFWYPFLVESKAETMRRAGG